jgi:hypothetical protein
MVALKGLTMVGMRVASMVVMMVVLTVDLMVA